MYRSPGKKKRGYIMKLALLNMSIATTAGTYVLEDISLQEAKKLVDENRDNLDSFIAYESTVGLLNELLGTTVEVDRKPFIQQPGQVALVLRVDQRVFGELKRNQLDELGYRFQKLTRTC